MTAQIQEVEEREKREMGEIKERGRDGSEMCQRIVGAELNSTSTYS